jgi:hypothetical protein
MFKSRPSGGFFIAAKYYRNTWQFLKNIQYKIPYLSIEQLSYNFQSAVAEYRLQKHGQRKYKNKMPKIFELSQISTRQRLRDCEKTFLSSCQIKAKPAVRRPGGRPTIHVSHD